MPRAVTPRIERKGKGRVWGADELSALLDVPARLVAHHCRVAAGMGSGALFFGAWLEAGEWCIPDRVARRVASDWPLQHYSVARVAELAEVSERQVRSRLKVVPAGVAIEQGRREWEIGARLFFGTQQRVPQSELSRLMDGRITGLPASSTTEVAA